MLRSCFDQFRSCFDQFRSAHHRLYSLSTVSFILRFFVTKFEATISCICNHDVKKPSTQKSFDSLRKHSKHMPHLSCEESVHGRSRNGGDCSQYEPAQFHRWGLWSVRSSDSNASASVLAVALKRRGKCTLRLPAWLSIARLLFDQYAIFRDYLHVYGEITSRGHQRCTSAVKMPNVSAMEVNLVRLFVRRALEEFYKHDKTEADADADTRRSSRQPREANNEPRVKSHSHFPLMFSFFLFKRRLIQTSTRCFTETSKATLRSFEIFCANSCGAPWELRTSTVSTSVSSYLPCFSCSVTYSDIYLASLYL
ncbi:BnaA01g30520D [Brassica napus]|uniref:BnaA01g30520D protein n=1 Tax=Brassica napus TaxID=3708 RepID=A0A078IND3_BRANA|nr:BnaA01g30520D [Brassica napus]